MAINALLLHYNNYFNRMIRRPSSGYNSNTSYMGSGGDIYWTILENINFNPADGVETSLIIGKGEIPSSAHTHLDTYDYLVIYDTTLSTTKNIVSRWFITDRDRTRDGQYKFSLRRDVVMDNLDVVQNSVTFVEKATLANTTDPLLYNNENMTYNQIKQSETPLKDSTGCGWVVGYIPQDAFTSAPKQIMKDVVFHSTADYNQSLANWSYYNLTQFSTNREIWTVSGNLNKQIILDTVEHWPRQDAHGTIVPEAYRSGKLYVPKNGTVTAVAESSVSSGVTANHVTAQLNPSFGCTGVASSMPSNSTLWSNFDTLMANMGIGGSIHTVTTSQLATLVGLNSKIFHDTDTDAYYRIRLVNVNAADSSSLDSSTTGVTTFMTALNNAITRTYTVSSLTVNVVGNYVPENVVIGYNGVGYQLVLEQVFTYAGVEIDSVRNHVADAPYDMFCIPYSDTKKLKIDNKKGAKCSFYLL